MSETQATTGQAAIDHLVRLLQMNPVHQGTEIIDARREALGLAKEAKATRSPPAEEVRALRRTVLDQLKSLRSQFWKMPIDELNKQLGVLDNQGFVDLEASIARIRVVAAHRDQFPLLGGMPGFDSDFFSLLKDVLVRSPRDTAEIREQILSNFRSRSRRKRGRRMVALLKTEMPAIYELEADWLDALCRQRIQPRVTLVTSSSARTGVGKIGSKSDASSYWWVIWIAIGVTSSLFRSMSNDRHSTYHPPTRSIPIAPSYQFKPTPPFIPREGMSRRVEDSKGFPESDKGVWQPYSTPSTPQSPDQWKSLNSFGNQEPFAPPKAPDPFEPWKKSDDPYSR